MVQKKETKEITPRNLKRKVPTKVGSIFKRFYNNGK